VAEGSRRVNEREDPQGTDWFGRLLVLLTLPMLVMAADPPFGSGSLSSLASVLAGALIGFWASRHYYQKASEEMKDEAERQRQLTRLMLRAMEEAGLVEFTPEGGLKLRGALTASGRTDVTVSAQVRRGSDARVGDGQEPG
jgi:hypothetical protein